MQLDLAGRKAFVTGSSKGIGRAIAEALHREGCSVALNARNSTALESVAGALAGSVTVQGDVSTSAGAKSVIEQATTLLGGLDILVCNVGSGRSVPPGTETADEWQRMFSLNFFSAVNCVTAATGALSSSQGSIVCISSICGCETLPNAPVAYSTAKTALNAYVRGIARPLARRGVRINAIAPGNIVFEGSVWEGKLAADAGSVNEMLEREVALGRLGTPGDVAELTAFLVSARAGFATGAVWTIDGGQQRS